MAKPFTLDQLDNLETILYDLIKEYITSEFSVNKIFYEYEVVAIDTIGTKFDGYNPANSIIAKSIDEYDFDGSVSSIEQLPIIYPLFPPDHIKFPLEIGDKVFVLFFNFIENRQGYWVNKINDTTKERKEFSKIKSQIVGKEGDSYLLGYDNSGIIVGSDETSEGNIGERGCVNIFAGRKSENISLDIDKCNASISVSDKQTPDLIHGLPKGTIGEIKDKATVCIVGDEIRIKARGNCKLIIEEGQCNIITKNGIKLLNSNDGKNKTEMVRYKELANYLLALAKTVNSLITRLDIGPIAIDPVLTNSIVPGQFVGMFAPTNVESFKSLGGKNELE